MYHLTSHSRIFLYYRKVTIFGEGAYYQIVWPMSRERFLSCNSLHCFSRSTIRLWHLVPFLTLIHRSRKSKTVNLIFYCNICKRRNNNISIMKYFEIVLIKIVDINILNFFSSHLITFTKANSHVTWTYLQPNTYTVILKKKHEWLTLENNMYPFR